MRDLAVTDKGSVQPYIKTGVHTLEMQVGERRIRVRFPYERVNISPAGILQRDIGRVEGKGIPDVGVLMRVIPFHLPAERHCLLRPPIRGTEIRKVEFFLQLPYAGVISELPFASAQHLHPVGFRPVLIGGDSPGFRRRGNKIVVDRQRVFVQDGEILIVWRDKQMNRAPFIPDVIFSAEHVEKKQNLRKRNRICFFQYSIRCRKSI